MSAGKGDTPRPISVPKDQFDQNWDRIFRPQEPRLYWEDQAGNIRGPFPEPPRTPSRTIVDILNEPKR